MQLYYLFKVFHIFWSLLKVVLIVTLALNVTLPLCGNYNAFTVAASELAYR